MKYGMSSQGLATVYRINTEALAMNSTIARGVKQKRFETAPDIRNDTAAQNTRRTNAFMVCLRM
jgi:hypothetical protein